MRSLLCERLEPRFLLCPIVDAGNDMETIVNRNTHLDGSTEYSLSSAWVKARGPGDVVFENYANANTTVKFTEPGRYQLRLEANDGKFTDVDYINVIVDTLLVDAGPDMVIPFGSVVALDATVESVDAVFTTWSSTRGPALVEFDDVSAIDTNATFPLPGEYVLRLEVSDPESVFDDFSSSVISHDEVTVTVLEPQTVEGFFVSPNGSPLGDGSIDLPWDLPTMLTRHLDAGDTIWLREGTYQGGWEFNWSGTADNPITIRAYPGERVKLDTYKSGSSPYIRIYGSHVILRDVEILNSRPDSRSTTNTDVNAPDYTEHLARGGLYNHGDFNRYVNLVIHDLINGLGFKGNGGEIYGSIIYNNGYIGSQRGIDHGIYAWDSNRTISDNVVFNNFDTGILFYGSSKDVVEDVAIVGNASFNNGIRDVHVGGNTPIREIHVAHNYTYEQNKFVGQYQREVLFGWTAITDRGLTLKDNYFASGQIRFTHPWQSVTSSGNTVDKLTGSVPSTGLNVVSNPTGTSVFIRPNKYEPGRANVIVYNWEKRDTIEVDLSEVLDVGAIYEVHHVYDLFGFPVASGVYDGGNVTIPMRSMTAPRALGGNVPSPMVQGSEFGVFVVRTK